MKKELLAVAMLLFAGGNLLAQPHVNDGTSYLMNQPLDMSTDFRDLSNTLFFADHLESFDAKSGEGLVNWKRGHLMPRQAFNTNGAQPRKMRMLDFPFTAYENDPNLKFKIDFVTPRTVRIRMLTTPVEPKPAAPSCWQRNRAGMEAGKLSRRMTRLSIPATMEPFRLTRILGESS